jgi:sulfite reductase alpha subunit-like flavoprotein
MSSFFTYFSSQFYVCGSRNLASGVKDKLIEVIKRHAENVDDKDAKQWFERNMSGRYSTDVFE